VVCPYSDPFVNVDVCSDTAVMYCFSGCYQKGRT